MVSTGYPSALGQRRTASKVLNDCPCSILCTRTMLTLLDNFIFIVPTLRMPTYISQVLRTIITKNYSDSIIYTSAGDDLTYIHGSGSKTHMCAYTQLYTCLRIIEKNVFLTPYRRVLLYRMYVLCPSNEPEGSIMCHLCYNNVLTDRNHQPAASLFTWDTVIVFLFCLFLFFPYSFTLLIATNEQNSWINM